MKIIYTTLLLLLLMACGNETTTSNNTVSSNAEGPDYWELSKFNVQDSFISNQAPIRLMYVSERTGNHSTAHFLHIMAVTDKGHGDTINILTTYANKFGPNDGNKYFEFVDLQNTSFNTKVLMSFMAEGTTVEDINNTTVTINAPTVSSDEYVQKVKEITKIIRDPKFDHLADNSFPTVIGSVQLLGNIE
ncbi:MAG: hypothetical protein GY810_13785 [Aureispira sp.]|nr:hypothetical protein [Aureispira sp.]